MKIENRIIRKNGETGETGEAGEMGKIPPARISTLTGFRTLLGLGQTRAGGDPRRDGARPVSTPKQSGVLLARICNPCVDNGTDYKSAPAGAGINRNEIIYE